MQRLLRFRAWTGKRMLWSNLHDRGWYSTPANDSEGCHWAFDKSQRDSAYLIIMQFTGLFDKKGNEIFESDIVIFSDWRPKEVCYLDKSFAGFTLKSTDLFLTSYDAKEMEIIGNIYQDKDLIK